MQEDALLFPAVTGGHLQPSALYAHFYKARDAAKRSDLRFHDLRHTGAVLAAQNRRHPSRIDGADSGIPLSAAALKYQHVAAGRDAQIAAALSKIARATRACLPMIWGVGGDDRAYDACGSDFG